MTLYFEDVAVGFRRQLGMAVLTEAEMIAFAAKYDPQPFHLDAAAAAPLFGGLIASGWQTASLLQRLMVEGFLNETASLASPGVDELRFLLPVYPGDILMGWIEVVAARPSQSKADRGIVRLRGEMVRGDDEVVLSLVGSVMMRRRPQP